MQKPFIVVIDDNETTHFPVRSVISQVFPEARVEAYLSFQSFLNGLDLLTSSPSLFMLDVATPSYECQQVIQWLKADSLWRKIPIVIFCDEADSDNLIECYDYGAASLIEKDKDWGKLGLALSTTLEYWFRAVHLPLLRAEELPRFKN
ncbi:response regulator [Larkinella soli]|uniref:response regulator n=1 Tax=Larkinella soli TaxID=1770527 RepID=UPI000FFB9CAB|nr:response regulator [Larkinella soli]